MLFNMNVLNGISLVIIIQGLFYALPVDSIDFCKMNKINIQRFQTECVLCSKNSHIECPRNATKVTSENGLQTFCAYPLFIEFEGITMNTCKITSVFNYAA